MAISPELQTTALKAAIDVTKPTLQKWFDKLFEKSEIAIKTTLKKDREHFWNYLERTYKKLLKIRPIGFQEPLDFLDVYIPLSIEDCKRNHEGFIIDGFPEKLLHKHTLIVDNAGMGKSTIAKRMFISVFENGNFGIPILIELRHLSKENNVINEILNQIKNLSSDFNENLLTTLVEKGGFVFFLDGYDEITYNEKTSVTESLQSFIEKASNNNTFILTSREDEALSGFQSFDQYSIKQLTEQDAYKLLRNLDNSGEKSGLLIEKLQNELSGVEDFLVNPLLVTLLFTAFDYEPTIPPKKYLFYDQVFNAFFQQHDLSKGGGWQRDKHCKLAKDDFERILRCIGFISIINHKIEFTRPEITSIIEKAKNNNRTINFQASDFLKDLIETVPLFTKDGTTYKWTHKSLAEYFAVEFIVRDSMKEEQYYIEKLYEKDDGVLNENLFDLYFDINPAGFRKYLLLPCLYKIKNEVLAKKEDIYKTLFCSGTIGSIIIIRPKRKKILNKFEYERDLDVFKLPNYVLCFDQKPSKKWWTVLRILIEKKYLFQFEQIPLPPPTKHQKRFADDSKIKNLLKNVLPTRKQKHVSKRFLDNNSNLQIDSIDSRELPVLKRFLDNNSELMINSSNIENYDVEIVFELLQILFFRNHRKSFPLLNRETCEKEIYEIEQEINNKKDFSSFVL